MRKLGVSPFLTSALGKQKQKGQDFKANHGNIASSRPLTLLPET